MPAKNILDQKQAVVDALVVRLKAAGSGVLFDYKGITVADDTALRNELRKSGVEYSVIKNTLLARAAKQCGLDGLIPHLEGTTALATATTEIAAPAKILSDFQKKSKDAYKIKAGFVEGEVLDVAGVAALASLPSKEVLVAKVLGTLNAPITGLVTVLNANIRGLAVALGKIAEKQSA